MNAEPDLLRIVHETVYRYNKPVSFQPHRLVLRPREGHDLRVEQLKLDIQPAHELLWSRDIFGNSVACAYFLEPADQLSIRNEILIRRFPQSAALRSEQMEKIVFPLEYDPLEQSIVAAYLAPVFPEENAALQQWLQSLHLDPCKNCAESMVLHLTALLKQVIAYRRRDEKGVQTPATTLTLGSGSCRDAATLLMEAVRHLGFAARFSSGYLDCQATRAARGVTHAWTEIYFPGLGWKGFDPTTGQPCTHQHIVTGVSNHPRGVMPVSGRFSGKAEDSLGMTVNVQFSGIEGRPLAA